MTRCPICHRLVNYITGGVCIMCHTEPQRKYQRIKQLCRAIHRVYPEVEIPTNTTANVNETLT